MGAETKVLSPEDHENALTTSSPAGLLLSTIIYGAAFVIFSQLQIASTEQAVYGFLGMNVYVPPGSTASQITAFTSGNMDKAQVIASAIGWGVQLAMFMIASPSDRVFLAVHKKYSKQSSASILENAAKLAKFKQFLVFMLIGGDILTDFLYVIAGHNLIGGSILGFIPLPSNDLGTFGIFIVGIMYPCVICLITIFSLNEALHRLDGLWDRIRGK